MGQPIRVWQKTAHVLFLMTALFLSMVQNSQAFGPSNDAYRYTPIRINIEMPKKAFSVGENVDGMINIDNEYMAALPAVFHVKIFHQDKLFYDFLTSVRPLIPGTTKFSFKDFGFPEFNAGKDSVGEWRITIVQKDVDPTYEESVNINIFSIGAN